MAAVCAAADAIDGEPDARVFDGIDQAFGEGRAGGGALVFY